LERAEYRRFPSDLIQAAGCDLVFVPTEIVAKFVQIGKTAFGAGGAGIFAGVIPEAIDVENNLGWQRQILGQFASLVGPGEQSEHIGRKPFGENARIRGPFVVHRHRFGQRADFGRQLALSGGDGFGRHRRQALKIHFRRRNVCPGAIEDAPEKEG
jgi:hypothetical protein